jgi:DNA-binding CsgD family transcriptional regulator
VLVEFGGILLPTEAQQIVLQFLEGTTSQTIARRMEISISTVENTIRSLLSIYIKFDDSRFEQFLRSFAEEKISVFKQQKMENKKKKLEQIARDRLVN